MPGDGSLGDSSIYINGQCKAIQEKFKDRFRHSYVKPIQQSFWLDTCMYKRGVTVVLL